MKTNLLLNIALIYRLNLTHFTYHFVVFSEYCCPQLDSIEQTHWSYPGLKEEVMYIMLYGNDRYHIINIKYMYVP